MAAADDDSDVVEIIARAVPRLSNDNRLLYEELLENPWESQLSMNHVNKHKRWQRDKVDSPMLDVDDDHLAQNDSSNEQQHLTNAHHQSAGQQSAELRQTALQQRDNGAEEPARTEDVGEPLFVEQDEDTLLSAVDKTMCAQEFREVRRQVFEDSSEDEGEDEEVTKQAEPLTNHKDTVTSTHAGESETIAQAASTEAAKVAAANATQAKVKEANAAQAKPVEGKTIRHPTSNARSASSSPEVPLHERWKANQSRWSSPPAGHAVSQSAKKPVQRATYTQPPTQVQKRRPDDAQLSDGDTLVIPKRPRINLTTNLKTFQLSNPNVTAPVSARFVGQYPTAPSAFVAPSPAKSRPEPEAAALIPKMPAAKAQPVKIPQTLAELHDTRTRELVRKVQIHIVKNVSIRRILTALHKYNMDAHATIGHFQDLTKPASSDDAMAVVSGVSMAQRQSLSSTTQSVASRPRSSASQAPPAAKHMPITASSQAPVANMLLTPPPRQTLNDIADPRIRAMVEHILDVQERLHAPVSVEQAFLALTQSSNMDVYQALHYLKKTSGAGQYQQTQPGVQKSGTAKKCTEDGRFVTANKQTSSPAKEAAGRPGIVAPAALKNDTKTQSSSQKISRPSKSAPLQGYDPKHAYRDTSRDIPREPKAMRK